MINFDKEIDFENWHYAYWQNTIISFKYGEFVDFSKKDLSNFGSSLESLAIYRHSSIYAVNVGTHTKQCKSKKRVKQGYLGVLKERKIG